MTIIEIIFKPKNVINNRWDLLCIEVRFLIISKIDKLLFKLQKGRFCGHTIGCRGVKEGFCSYKDYCCKTDMYGGAPYGITRGDEFQ